MCGDCTEVHHDPAFVVGHTPSIQPSLALGGLERIGGPLVCRTGRLNVIVGVEEKRGRTLGGRDLRKDRRVASLQSQELGVLEPRPVEDRDDCLCRLVHFRLVVAGRADRRKPDQVAEDLGEPGEVGGNSGP